MNFQEGKNSISPGSDLSGNPNVKFMESRDSLISNDNLCVSPLVISLFPKNEAKSHQVSNDAGRLSLSKSDSSQLMDELEEKIAELDSVRKEFENRQSKLNDLKQMHEELNLKISDIEFNRENILKELASEAQKNEVSKNNVKSLQWEIERLKSLKASDEEKIDTDVFVIDSVNKHIEINEKRYDATNNQMESTLDAQLQKEINNYKQEIKELRECLELTEKEKKNLLVTISEKTKGIAEMEAELFLVKHQLITAKSDLEGKNLQIKDLKNDLNLSHVQIQEKISQLEASKETLERKESEFNAMKEEYEKLKCNFEVIANEKDCLQNSLNSKRQTTFIADDCTNENDLIDHNSSCSELSTSKLSNFSSRECPSPTLDDFLPSFKEYMEQYIAEGKLDTEGVDCSLSTGSNSNIGSSDVQESVLLMDRRKIEKPASVFLGRQNDNYCWACHREITYLTCITCPRTYHFRCSGEINLLVSANTTNWVCPECQGIAAAEKVSKQNRSSSLAEISLDRLGALLKLSLNKIKQKTPIEFHQPVSLEHFPTYFRYIIHPMDFSLLEKNIEQKVYGSIEAFLADVKWISHNSCIYNGTQHALSTAAKNLVKSFTLDMQEIEICPDCFGHSVVRKEYWFAEVCQKPHPLVWAKLIGFPYWPAKVVRIVGKKVDARFFGSHNQSWVPMSQCYHLSKKRPSKDLTKKDQDKVAFDELNVHINFLIQKFDSFLYAPYRTHFNPENKTLMFHGIDIDKVSKEDIAIDSSPLQELNLVNCEKENRSERFLESDPSQERLKTSGEIPYDPKVGKEDTAIDSNPLQELNLVNCEKENRSASFLESDPHQERLEKSDETPYDSEVSNEDIAIDSSPLPELNLVNCEKENRSERFLESDPSQEKLKESDEASYDSEATETSEARKSSESCEFCHSEDNEEKLLLCNGCNKRYHTYCIKPAMETIPEEDWYCSECLDKVAETSEAIKSSEMCEFCHSEDNEEKLLLCDGCDKGYHTYCVKPALETIPEEDWYCPECLDKHCQFCHSDENEEKLLLCHGCIKGYHTYCFEPAMETIPEEDWYCFECLEKTAETSEAVKSSEAFRELEYKKRSRKPKITMAAMKFEYKKRGRKPKITKDAMKFEYKKRGRKPKINKAVLKFEYKKRGRKPKITKATTKDGTNETNQSPESRNTEPGILMKNPKSKSSEGSSEIRIKRKYTKRKWVEERSMVHVRRISKRIKCCTVD